MKKQIPSLLISLVLAGMCSTALCAAPQDDSAAPAPFMAKKAAEKTTSTPEGWTDDFEAAKKEAKAKKKYLLVDFSGSDWCGWCVRLDKEVFSKKEFVKAAKNKFVLVFIDNPMNKDRLSPLGKKQNWDLTQKYGVRGFPTVLLMDADGTKFAATGYRQGGPEKYMEHLNALLKSKKGK